MRVCFYTLGCKVNQYETQALSGLFADNGYTVTNGPAELFVVNSCTVTAQSDHKVEKLCRRLRREYPTAVIALTGCIPQGAPERAALMTDADIVTGSKDRAGLLHAVNEFLKTGARVVRISPYEAGDPFENLHIDSFEGHTRAFLKIQDGCERGCAYCIIPKVRGSVRSKDPGELANELSSLAAAGYKEVVLVGINLALYGRERGLRLIDAVRIACGTDGIERVRLGSTEFDLIGDSDFLAMSKFEKLCPHFHLPLQSGCDRTLKRMNRRYTTQDYRRTVELIRRHYHNPAITADIIVGLPGEDEAQFCETMDFVRSIDLADAHLFPYSAREGTQAAAMSGQLSQTEKNLRLKRLAEAVNESRQRFLESQLGLTARVLFQRGGNGYTENYTLVTTESPPPPGKIREVLLKEVCGEGCFGAVI